MTGTPLDRRLPARRRPAPCGLAVALLACSIFGGGAVRAADLNEVGAVLVYPLIQAVANTETLVTVTNTGMASLTLHVSLIDGFEGTPQHPNPQYCSECDFDLPMTGNDTVLLAIRKDASGATDVLVEDDPGAEISCPFFLGMLVVTARGPNGLDMTDNVLLGSEVVIEYAMGWAHGLSAVPFQGRTADGSAALSFDDVEYGRLPRVLATDFIAPSPGNAGALTAELALFTLGFQRLHPPRTVCSVTGYDANENPFSSSFQFGCWTLKSLWEISPEFAWGNLGQSANHDSHGWLSLSCRVDQAADGVFEARGGVHGALVQKVVFPTTRPPLGSGLTEAVAWGSLLQQSVTTGDPVALRLSTSTPF